MTSKIIHTTLQLISWVVSVYIISRREFGVYKLMWVFLILLFPVFGGLFYLLFTFQSSTKRFQKRIMHAEEKSKDLWSLPETGYAEALTKAPEHAQQIRYLQDSQSTRTARRNICLPVRVSSKNCLRSLKRQKTIFSLSILSYRKARCRIRSLRS